MADGLNEARAMRVAEVMNGFHILQRGISELQVNAPSDEWFEEGYEILRQCRAEGQAVLAADYVADLLHVPSAPGEQEKRQLQRVLLDASARRFQAKKIHLRALAAMRWVNGRYAVLQGQKPHQGHTAAMQRTDQALRLELAAVTNERVFNDLRMADQQAGYYLQDDPSLQRILTWLNSD